MKKKMKPLYEEFCCPQCGELRHINVNGICFDCNNENTLVALAKQRKMQHKLDILFHSLSVES
jgi:predicted ATP-dependent serine protease